MKKNIAIVGYGGQGGWHADWALKSDVVNLAGIFDTDSKQCQKAADKNIRVYQSLDEILNDSAVDIVVCATPNDSHEDIVVRSLLSGKNVVCEKPVALSVDSFDRMVEAAKKSGKVFTVHQNRRWDVDFLAIKNIIESNEIGDALRVESRIHGSRGIPSDWRCHEQYGGGMILDWGVHLIDQALQLITDDIDSVSCNCTHITTDEVDDGFRLEIKFVTGKTAYIEVGTYNFIAMPRFYLQCKKGSAMITDWREKAQVVLCKAWNECDVLPVQTAAGITKTMAPRDEITVDTYQKEKPQSDVHDFYRNLCNAIDGKEQLLITNEQVRRVLEVMQAAFCSDKQKGVAISL